MYQYDDSSAVAEPPAATAPGTLGYYIDGDPTTGQAPSIVRAEHLNMMMCELLAILTVAEVTPSKTVFNQIAMALKPVLTDNYVDPAHDAQYSLTIPLTNLVIKFGVVVDASGMYGKVNFTAPFTGSLAVPFALNLSVNSADAAIGFGATAQGDTNTGGYTSDLDGMAWSSTASIGKFAWLCIGSNSSV